MIERSLIIQKKYLDLVFDNGKVWEMRTTMTNIRGRIGLIEAGSGLIVGEVDIIDSLPAIETPLKANATANFHQVYSYSLLEKWKYPWVLENAKRFDKPIPYDHPQGAVIWVKHEDLK